MEELVPLLREAVDRKQENMRRRRRRDALRLNLNKMLLLIAQRKTFANRYLIILCFTPVFLFSILLKSVQCYSLRQIQGVPRRLKILEKTLTHSTTEKASIQLNISVGSLHFTLTIQICELCFFLPVIDKKLPSSSFALDGGSLHSSLTEYLDGVRQCLEVEAEKDAPAAREQRLTFADFVTELIQSFPRKTTLDL